MSSFSQYQTPSAHQRNKEANNFNQAEQAEYDLVSLIYGCPPECKDKHKHETGMLGEPLKFVLAAYPWGIPGPLQAYEGPDNWQREVLIELGEAIRKRKFNGVDAVSPIKITRSSGHGIGKGVMTAMLTDFIMSTRINAIGTITANTYGQLETKTWANVQKWTKLCITSHWFTVTGNMMFQNEAREQWFTAALSCAEENSQAFAGQHNANSTSFYIFDEASNVPDAIFNVADGGLTDGEPMIFVFGNPTRSSGKFYRINFGGERHRWNHKAIDSRMCRYTNKQTLKEWEEDWGEDSDRFRVQVKGIPPSASDLQFISSKLVTEAQKRPITVLRNDPVVCGLDISRGGSDNCVFRFRRGQDARSIPAIRISGEQARDSTVLENRALDILKNGVIWTDGANIRHRYPVTQMFVDGTGVGGPVADHLKNLGFEKQVTEIQFSWESPNTQGYQACANMRSWMWENLRVWLERGGIDISPDLESDLTGPMFHYNTKNELVLESKENMKKRRGTITASGSPDDGDALALTFARPVAPRVLQDRDEDEHETLNSPEDLGFIGGFGTRVWG